MKMQQTETSRTCQSNVQILVSVGVVLEELRGAELYEVALRHAGQQQHGALR